MLVFVLVVLFVPMCSCSWTMSSALQIIVQCVSISKNYHTNNAHLFYPIDGYAFRSFPILSYLPTRSIRQLLYYPSCRYESHVVIVATCNSCFDHVGCRLAFTILNHIGFSTGPFQIFGALCIGFVGERRDLGARKTMLSYRIPTLSFFGAFWLQCGGDGGDLGARKTIL